MNDIDWGNITILTMRVTDNIRILAFGNDVRWVMVDSFFLVGPSMRVIPESWGDLEAKGGVSW